MEETKNTEQTATDVYTLLYTGGLGRYLIMVGIRSLEYTYTDEQIFANVEYFDKCRKRGLSAYKALLFFHDYLNGDYDILPLVYNGKEYELWGMLHAIRES